MNAKGKYPMKKLNYFFILANCTILVIGCTSIQPLQPGAEKVLITSNTVPRNCHYIGQVSDNDDNGSTQIYSSHQHLQADEINRLKNKALKLDANVVMLTSHQTSYVATIDGRKRVDTHRMSGKAYFCPTNTLNDIKEGNLSDVKNDE